MVFSQQARPVRFAITGGLAGLMQLALLKLLTDHGWPALVANGVAFLLAAQLNFVLSSLFTWRDRQAGRSLGRRWLAFHGAIASMAVVNLVVFAAARLVLPDLAASAAGICAAAAGNFFIGDRLVFRPRRADDSRRQRSPEPQAAA
jgi:putative flippase GtrA